MPKKDNRQIMGNFEVRRRRQLLAIGTALFLMFFLAAIYKLPAILGEFSKNTIFGAQVIVIATFIGFTGYNWICPACHRYLGNDIGLSGCRKCGSRLK